MIKDVIIMNVILILCFSAIVKGDFYKSFYIKDMQYFKY